MVKLKAIFADGGCNCKKEIHGQLVRHFELPGPDLHLVKVFWQLESQTINSIEASRYPANDLGEQSLKQKSPDQ